MIKHIFLALITVIVYILYLIYYLIWDFSNPFMSFYKVRESVYEWWERDISDDFPDGWE